MKKTTFVTKLNSTISTPATSGINWLNNSVTGQCFDCQQRKPLIYGYALKGKWKTLLCADCQAAVA